MKSDKIALEQALKKLKSELEHTEDTTRGERRVKEKAYVGLRAKGCFS